MKKVPGNYVVVLVTCGSRREARKIACAVVGRRLAACVNILDAPVHSIYRWKGKIEEGREFLLMMKSARARLPALEAEVTMLHSYDVPEFIALPIVDGSEKYLAWLGDCLENPRPENRRTRHPQNDPNAAIRRPHAVGGLGVNGRAAVFSAASEPATTFRSSPGRRPGR